MANRGPVALHRLRTVAVLLALLLGMAWCKQVTERSQIAGVVIDNRTGRPVVGAIAVAWVGKLSLIPLAHGSLWDRAQVAETRTNDAGQFMLTLVSRKLLVLASPRARRLVVVAEGYQPVALKPYDLDQLVDSTGDDEAVALRISLEPLTVPPGPEAYGRVLDVLADAYDHSSLLCAESEVPQLVTYLRQKQALPAGESIDKRKWDVRRDCVD